MTGTLNNNESFGSTGFLVESVSILDRYGAILAAVDDQQRPGGDKGDMVDGMNPLATGDPLFERWGKIIIPDGTDFPETVDKRLPVVPVKRRNHGGTGAGSDPGDTGILGGHIDGHGGPGAETNQRKARLIEIVQTPEIIKDSPEVARPPRQVDIAAAIPRPPEIEPVNGQPVTAERFRQLRIAAVTGLRRTAGGSPVTKANQRVFSFKVRQEQLPDKRKTFNLQAREVFYHF
jgi:hypothetical protein